MFGFPFITSLVVAVVGVIVMSLLINKGLAKRANNSKADNTTLDAVQVQANPKA